MGCPVALSRDHEIRILAATLERLKGRDEIVAMLTRISPKARFDLRVAIHAVFAEQREQKRGPTAMEVSFNPELNPWMQPKLLRSK